MASRLPFVPCLRQFFPTERRDPLRMLLYVVLFAVGIGLLYVGAEGLVQGASSLALRYGLRPAVVGLTVVALGTSMPEFLVNLFAVVADESALALGNIIGSNISNVALILGSSALVLPLTVTPELLRREYPVMLGVMVLFYACALDGVIGTLDGIGMVVILVGLVGYLLYDARQAPATSLVAEMDDDLEATDPGLSPLMRGLYLIGGSVGLALGAHLMVDSAKTVAHQLGVDPVVVGLTVVALGTSLPELAASMVSAVKEAADMSVGNVLGSNLLNVLFVVGTISIVEPLEVDRRSLMVDFPAMLGFCALLFPLTWVQHRLSRLGGSLLVGGFVWYMAYLLFPYL